MGSDDVSRRLRRLEDRSELRELTVRYCLAIDDSDWDALLGLFAAGAEMAGQVGPENIVGILRSIRSGYGRTIHTAHGQVLEFSDDDHASGIVPSRGELAIGEQTVLCAMRYFDRYVRLDGKWLFASRVLRFNYALPWADMAESMTGQLPVAWPGADPLPADEMREASRA